MPIMIVLNLSLGTLVTAIGFWLIWGGTVAPALVGTMGLVYLVARPGKLCLARGVDDSTQRPG
jgi:hypothetical protein